VLTRIAGRALALPIEHVVETMRPLPIDPIAPGDPIGPGDPGAGAPACVLGTAQIRGERVRVIDLARLLGRPSGARPGRFITVRAGDTRIALQVDSVIDVRELGEGAPLGPVPGLRDVVELTSVLQDARWVDGTAPETPSSSEIR